MSPSVLARILGVQYVIGGLLAVGWVLVPAAGPQGGEAVVLTLGALAIGLGAAMSALAVSQLSDVLLDRAAHACILSAQAVITVAHAATQDPASPLLFFLLWSTPYGALFSRRARWAHVATTAVLVGASSVAMPGPARAQAAVSLVIVVATVVVLALLVSRMTNRLRYIATHDALTGLPNRRMFHALVSAALDRRATHGGSVSVLLVDLDRFKNVNDSFGHDTGDALLVEVAARLHASLGPTDVVARLGGDEFVVLSEDRSGRPGAGQAAARLDAAWSAPVTVGGRRLYVSGSVGVAVADDGDTAQSLLRDADIAMYEAKSAGGGRCAVFDPASSGRSARLIALEQGLRDAADRGELAVHYQPVVALSDARPLGVEALVRWTSADLGPVAPDEFIPVAESTGLIDQLGEWVLDRALRDLAHWRRTGLVDPCFRVAVNLSPHQLTDTLPERVLQVLARHAVPAACLGLEITESAVMTGGTPDAVLARLREHGVVLLLDDFGTGFSSLSHLRRLPLDVVKIDRSFVAGMCEHGDDSALIVGVLSLAHALGKWVVAEGIETQEQLEQLLVLGCDAGQGYLLSRPVPADALPAALAAVSTRRTSASCRLPVGASRRSRRSPERPARSMLGN